MRTSLHAAATRVAAALAFGLALVAAAAAAEAAEAAAEAEAGAPAPEAAPVVPAEQPPARPAPDAADLLLEAEYEEPAPRDPLEASNRVVFGGNEVLYQRVFDPLADAYAFAVPGAVRRSLVRFFDNLGEPADCLNELLQLDPGGAGRTGIRFLVNSTAGVAGLFDPAARLGLGEHSTDFGETLGAYGVGDGWYLVVPLLGPSTVRDLFGDVVDGFFHPQAYVLGYAYQALLTTSGGFSRYEAERERVDALRQSSVDFYAALRSAYLMQRAASVREARAGSPVLRRLERERPADHAVAAPAGTGD